jgi:hypothetical protein
MSGVQIFFIIYFGIMAACIVHQFFFCANVTSEFLAKVGGGMVGAWLGPMALGRWGIAAEGVWFLPELIGSLIAAGVVAAAWSVFVHHGQAAAHETHPGISHTAH